jgi:hypothetical protein
MTGRDGNYVAGKGYDIATGIGSPNVTDMLSILATL